MRSSYGGPGSSRSTWKPNQDPGKQAPASCTTVQRGVKNEGNRATGNTANEHQSTQQHDTEQKKE